MVRHTSTDISPPAPSEPSHVIDLRKKSSSSPVVFTDDWDMPVSSIKKIKPKLVFSIIVIILSGLLFGMYQLGFLQQWATQSKQGVASLIQAKDSIKNKDINQAKVYLEQAEQTFLAAQGIVRDLQNSDYNSNGSLLSIGSDLARIGIDVTQLVKRLEDLAKQSLLYQPGATSLTDNLNTEFDQIKAIGQKVEVIRSNVNSIPTTILTDSQKVQFENLSNHLETLAYFLHKYEPYREQVLTLLGHKLPQRYLLLFQNTDEARATGGFIGSYAIVDVNDGYITNFEIQDVYNLDGSFHEDITPPYELSILTDNWRLRDSNYSPHFPASAAKSAWFLEEEGGPSVDHVIAINSDMLTEIIRLAGGITIADSKQVVAPDDITFILSYIVESKFRGAQNPKSILSEIKDTLFLSFQNGQLPLNNVVEFLHQAVKHKHIQVWSKNESVQKLVQDFGVDGSIMLPQPGEDYLNIISISASGNKASRYINESVIHNTHFDIDGAITNTLTLNIEHAATLELVDYWRSRISYYNLPPMPDWIARVMGYDAYKGFYRVYLPPESSLQVTETTRQNLITMEYDADINMPFVRIPISLNPGEKKNVTFSYQIAMPQVEKGEWVDYVLHLQSQPGHSRALQKTITFNANGEVVTSSPADRILDQDQYFSALINLAASN